MLTLQNATSTMDYKHLRSLAVINVAAVLSAKKKSLINKKCLMQHCNMQVCSGIELYWVRALTSPGEN